MEHGFSILMFIFAAAILLYAALMAITKDYNILPTRATMSVKPKDEKAYMTRLAKVIALVAVVPVLTGVAAFWNAIVAVFVFVIGLVAACWAGAKMMKGVM